jgi:hypothetical protein
MGQSLTVQDDFYIFPVGNVFYVKFRDPATRKLLTNGQGRNGSGDLQ